MRHEEQLREVKKNNTILEKKLEHERFVKSLHTSKKKFDFQFFFFHVSCVLSLYTVQFLSTVKSNLVFL